MQKITNEIFFNIALDQFKKVVEPHTASLITEDLLSGNPDDVYGGCGTACVDPDLILGLNMASESNFQLANTNYSGGAGHRYLVEVSGGSREDDKIFDYTSGQFIPPSSRVGYEYCFKGNMFVGSRSLLREIAQKGVINTSTAANSVLSFQRIWGDESMIFPLAEASLASQK